MGVYFVALGVADVLRHFEAGSYISNTVSRETNFSQKSPREIPVDFDGVSG